MDCRGKTATTVAVIQLLTVSAIGSEWYYAVFHRAMLKLPPYMDLSTYAAYAGAFLFMILLVMISTPTKNTETKSMWVVVSVVDRATTRFWEFSHVFLKDCWKRAVSMLVCINCFSYVALFAYYIHASEEGDVLIWRCYHHFHRYHCCVAYKFLADVTPSFYFIPTMCGWLMVIDLTI